MANEDGALANSYEFNKLLIDKSIQLETTGGHGSKLNKIIERPNREHHFKTRIALGTQSKLRFAREHVTFIKRRTWHTGIDSTPYYK